MIRPLSLTRSSSWGRGMVCGMRSEGARGGVRYLRTSLSTLSLLGSTTPW